MESWLPLLLARVISRARRSLGRRYALGQALQFAPVQYLRVDHANQQRLDGSGAEPVHDAFDGAARYALRRLCRRVDKRSVLNGVRQIALLFKTPQYRANRRFFEGASKFFAHLLSCQVAETPNQQQYAALQFAEIGRIVIESCVTSHSVTNCST